MKTCAIIVTFNRKNLLIKCIEAVLTQTTKCDEIFIIDNASTDGTALQVTEYFKLRNEIEIEKLSKLGSINDITINYYLMSSNSGGSGGFSKGMKIAHKLNKFEAFWLMDDDGYPSPSCLEKLIKYLPRYDYVMPASIDIENHKQMSWPTVLKEGGKSLFYSDIINSWNEIMDYIYPFNGSLMSKRLLDEVGYVDKRLFIWGDEYDHYWRCKEKNFSPKTIVNAIFYHPANKMAFVPILKGLFKVPYVDCKWKMVCLARNYTYIYRKYHQKYKIPLKFVLYSWLFLITRKGDFSGWKLYLNSVKDGFKENFERHKEYLK